MKHLLTLIILIPFYALGNSIDPLPMYSLQFYGEGYFGMSTYQNRRFQEDFYYNHHQLRSPKINYAQVLFEKKYNTWQYQLGIHDGVYVRRNYADQPTISQLLSHANIQYSAQKLPGLKIMAGIFPSHIGFESVRSDANLTASRSMLAENSPYYESGIQSQYQPINNKWKVGIYLLTGWQQAQIVTPAENWSVGWSSQYNPLSNWSIYYNGFKGFTHTASNQSRSYHNFYTQYQNNKWNIIFGFDYGTAEENSSKKEWYSPVGIVQMQCAKSCKMALRYEYMQFPSSNFLLIDGNTNWDRRTATSLNFDYTSKRNWLWRIEYKQAWGLGYENGNKDMNWSNNNLLLLSLSKSFQLSF